MKTFTVSYRKSDGSLAEIEIVAADRAECMAECRKQGVTPVGIHEGRSSVRSKSKKNAGSPNGEAQGAGQGPRTNVRWGLVGVAAAVAGALVIAIWLSARTQSAPPNDPKPKAAVASPKAVATPPPPARPARPRETVPSTNEAATVSPAMPKGAEIPATNIVKVISVVTNANGSVTERYVRADGKKIRLIKPAPQLFKHGSDDVLAMIATTPPGREMPPLPPGAFTKEQFLQSLNDPIVITDEDPEHVKLIKQSVTALREEMKALLDQGQSVEQILADHQKLHQENVEVRTQALLEVKKLLDAGDRKEAIHYATMINVALQQMGIESLPVPAEDTADEPARRARPNKGESK